VYPSLALDPDLDSGDDASHPIVYSAAPGEGDPVVVSAGIPLPAAVWAPASPAKGLPPFTLTVDLTKHGLELDQLGSLPSNGNQQLNTSDKFWKVYWGLRCEQQVRV
jgi:hypothetical protein